MPILIKERRKLYEPQPLPVPEPQPPKEPGKITPAPPKPTVQPAPSIEDTRPGPGKQPRGPARLPSKPVLVPTDVGVCRLNFITTITSIMDQMNKRGVKVVSN